MRIWTGVMSALVVACGGNSPATGPVAGAADATSNPSDAREEDVANSISPSGDAAPPGAVGTRCVPSIEALASFAGFSITEVAIGICNGRDDRDDVSNTCPRAAERPAQGPIRPTRVHQPFGSADRVLLVSLRQCERSLRRRSNVLCMPTRLRLRTVRTALRPPRRQRGCVLHQERHGLGSLRAVQTVRRADAKLPTVQRAGGRRVD